MSQYPMIDLSNWITQLPSWLMQAWHWIVHIFHAVLAFLGASEREKISTAVWENADGTIAKIITTTDTIPAKTVWDLLALVGIPVTLAVLTFVFQSQQKKQEQKREDTEKELQQKREDAEKARQHERLREESNEKALEDYLNQVSTLLIQNNLLQLAQDEPDSHVLDTAKGVIRARTLSLLKRLTDDIARKNTVVEFLIESQILGFLKLNLSRIDLSKVDLRAANLHSMNLRKADLSGSDVRGVDLREADLSLANLNRTQLFGARLSKTNFSGSHLEHAILCRSCMHETDLKEAKLQNADLRMADLYEADLRMANLSGANLSFTNFNGAIFEKTIMPDGIARSGEDAKQYIKAHYL